MRLSYPSYGLLLCILLIEASSSTNFLLQCGCATYPWGTVPVTAPRWSPPVLSTDDSTVGPLIARVISPSSLAGNFAFSPPPFNGDMFINNTCQPDQECTRRFVLQLQNQTYEGLYGCFNRTKYTDGGELLDATTMIMVERQGGHFRRSRRVRGCNFGQKVDILRALGVGGILHAANVPNPKLTITLVSSYTPNVVSPYIQYADAVKFRTYINLRNEWLRNSSRSGIALPSPYSDPVILEFTATGPLIASEREALLSIVKNSSLIITESAIYPAVSRLRGWTDMIANPQIDPCMNRIIGLWCERGRVVTIWLNSGFSYLKGALPPAFGEFPTLRLLEVSRNGLTGSMPIELCKLTNLLTLRADSQTITRLPDCLGMLQNLLVLTVRSNQVTNIPTTLAADRTHALQYLNLDRNKISAFSANFSNQLANLVAFTFASNIFSSTSDSFVPSFKGWMNLTLLTLAGCNLTNIQPDFLDQTSLTSIDLSNNLFTGSLPNLVSDTMKTSLVSIIMNNNSFTGGIPDSWKLLSAITTVRVQSNLLTGPIDVLSAMSSLTSASLQDNKITVPAGSNVGALIQMASPATINELFLDRNAIDGEWKSGYLTNIKAFKTLSLSGNKIRNLPIDLFNIAIQSLDLSYNALNGSLPSSTVPTILNSLNVVGNPLLAQWPLASFFTLDPTTSIPNGVYSCLSIISTLSNLPIRVLADPTFTKYNGCQCNTGTFGKVPLCSSIPETAELSPIDGLKNDQIGANFAAIINTNITSTLDLNSPQGFSDQWYGSHRLTPGISTTYFINIQNLFLDIGVSIDSESMTTDGDVLVSSLPMIPTTTAHVMTSGNASNSYIPSTRVSGLAKYQPVRMIAIQIHLSRTLFHTASDLLSVYDTSLDGERVASFVGTDRFSDSIQSPDGNTSITQTSDYIVKYCDQIAEIQNRTLLEVIVWSNAAMIHFTSRASSGQFFFATYSYAYSCQPETKYFLDDSDGVYKCIPQLPLYIVDWDVRVAVFVVASLCLIWIIVNVIVIGVNWSSPVYRAASRTFLLLMLFFLATMSLGAMLYGAIPSGDTTTSRAICHGRVWLTCAPLAGILAILFGRANRVEKIFGSVSILRVQSVSDLSVLKYVILFMGVDIITLAFFSIFDLSQPIAKRGVGSLSDHLVVSCSLEPNAMIWIGIQIGIFVVLMMITAFVAFKTRNLPSAFQESSHILNGLVFVMFFSAIIVLIDFTISELPRAAVLLQGSVMSLANLILGQGFLVALFSIIIYTPKLWIVLRRSEASLRSTVSISMASNRSSDSVNNTRSDSVRHMVHRKGGGIPTPRSVNNKGTPMSLPIASSPSTQTRTTLFRQSSPIVDAVIESTQQPPKADDLAPTTSSLQVVSPANEPLPVPQTSPSINVTASEIPLSFSPSQSLRSLPRHESETIDKISEGETIRISEVEVQDNPAQ